MEVNMSQVGTWLGAIILGIGSFWGNYAIDKAKKRAKKAEYGAEESTFAAENKLYQHLRQRLEALEKDTASLRSELDFERKRGRYLETHIWKLEDLMRKEGMSPPVFTPPVFSPLNETLENADQRET